MLKGFFFVVPVSPDGLEVDIGNAVKENTEKSVKCKASSSNPASLVDMEFFIDEIKQTYKLPQVNKINGSNSGLVKTFAFTFTTDRSQNGKIAKCSLKWNGTYLTKAEVNLNITCE